MKSGVPKWFLALLRLTALVLAFQSASAFAATCGQATSQGTSGPADWQTYCWIDMSSYNDTTARSASGQNFSIALSDGSTLTFNVKVTTSAAAASPALSAVASPSWTGAAFGNSAFIGIPAKPILYTATGGTTSTITISTIQITPPAGVPPVTAYSFVVADGESTAAIIGPPLLTESIKLTTDGVGWVQLDSVAATSGPNMPTQTGLGSSTLTWTGNSGDPVGSYVVSSNSPTKITTTLTPIGGLEGALFAVRFASLKLNKQIVGARANAADQFNFTIAATSNGAVLATGTTTGTGLGPFTAAAVSLASGIPLTISEVMATGSTNTLPHYSSVLTCTNGTSGSTTVLPSNLATTSYDFGALKFGDAVSCTFTNKPYPHLTLQKALAASGRQFATDQFVMNVSQGSTVVATATTTGTGSTVSTGVTPQYQGSAGIAYKFAEAGSGATSLAQYTATMACSNLWAGSTTSLATSPGGSITPQIGDVITCTITNTKLAANALLTISKTEKPFSDPVVGATNSKLIPGAIVSYTFTVSNTGSTAVDNNTVWLIDALPSQLRVGTAASPVFTQGSPTSGLTFTAATDIRYSNAGTMPTSFAQCTYTPTSAYDANVHYVCLNPKGTMSGSTGTPPSFQISIQAQVQ
jgi:uncharacterized repeat protein (TIGR01451 family)